MNRKPRFSCKPRLSCCLLVLAVCVITVGCQMLPGRDDSKSKPEVSLLSKAAKPKNESKPVQQKKTDLSPERAADACIATAEQFEQAGHHREAIALYERARSEDADRPGLSHRIAILCDQVGEHAKAKTEYVRALKQSPQDSSLLNDYGYYHFCRGNLDEAEPLFRQAIGRDSDNERAHANLARVLAERGKHDESLELFADIVGPAAAYSNLGVIVAKQDRQAAVRYFEKALELDSTLQQPKAFLSYWANANETTDQTAATDAASPVTVADTK